MFRRIILVLLFAGLLTPSVTAGVRKQQLIVTIKNRKALDKLRTKFKSRIIAQVPGQPIFLIEVDDKKSVKKKIKKEKAIVDVEENGRVTVQRKKSSSGSVKSPLDLDQSTMSLFQGVLSLYGDAPAMTEFFGTTVRDAYANQPAMDIVRVSDIRHLTTGAGTRIAFIDTGVDPDHSALAPWLEPGVDLLGSGSSSEFSGLDQSTMSLFWDAVRAVKSGATLDQSTMSLFWEQLLAGTLDQSTMSLFWDQFLSGAVLDQSTMSLFWDMMGKLGVDQSTMSLFWEQMKSLDLDQSTMSLFWTQLFTGTLDQSTMSLFWDHLHSLELDQSTMSLFWKKLEFLYVNQSTMSLFWQEALRLEQSTMSLFGDQLASLDQSTMSLFEDGSIFDDFGHGTMVAGLIHLTAPEASLVPVKAFDSSGDSTLFLAIAGVYAAIQLDVDVINMSFSIGGDSNTFERALQVAWGEGIALVASAGNDATNAKNVYLAAYPTVIAVASTDSDDHLADFSNYGRAVTVTAPGQGVVSTFPGGLWAKASGTSFSAPIVSGSIGLLVSLGKASGTAAKAVVNNADSIDALNPEFKRQLGRGRINILEALGIKH